MDWVEMTPSPMLLLSNDIKCVLASSMTLLHRYRVQGLSPILSIPDLQRKRRVPQLPDWPIGLRHEPRPEMGLRPVLRRSDIVLAHGTMMISMQPSIWALVAHESSTSGAPDGPLHPAAQGPGSR